MKTICINENILKKCDRPIEQCSHCAPGNRIKVALHPYPVLVELAGNYAEHFKVLESLSDALMQLSTEPGLGQETATKLMDISSITARLALDTHVTGGTLYINMLFNRKGYDPGEDEVQGVCRQLKDQRISIQ